MCWISSRLAMAGPMDVLTSEEFGTARADFASFVPDFGHSATRLSSIRAFVPLPPAADATQAGTGQSGTLGARGALPPDAPPQAAALHGQQNTMVLSP